MTLSVTSCAKQMVLLSCNSVLFVHMQISAMQAVGNSQTNALFGKDSVLNKIQGKNFIAT
jgi:hypothetical protein